MYIKKRIFFSWDNKLHRWFFKLVYHRMFSEIDHRGKRSYQLIKMKGWLLGIINCSGQYYKIAGMPEYLFGTKYYSFPYIHGYFIEKFSVLWSKIK